MRQYSIALIPGDGIGVDVIREGKKVLDTIADIDGSLAFSYREFDWSCEYYLRHGKMMPEDGLETLKGFDTIYLGAVGYPGVQDHVSLWGLLLPIRRTFQQYINLRPVKLLRGIRSPLAGRGAEDLDFLVVRENNEGEYSNMGGRIYEGTEQDMAIQNTVFTRTGVERVLRYAFQVARDQGKRRRLTAATKSNGINYTMPFWDEYVRKIQQEFPDVETSLVHIDALAAFFVTKPDTFDVVVASNLFGDILTDLGAAIVGGIGIAPSANINPEKKYPSMFEPVHGSAPDIAGKGIANPVAAIWCASMMLDHFGESAAAEAILEALQDVLEEGQHVTPDLGGSARTEEMGEAVCDKLKEKLG
ncbi:tartrate dehydrogenase [Kroppenstedtia eburnea]|uniref:D-malate dehydrogenase (decarboxylating) n=1 Tax=Kroppenstedtia eburnea TaxID=714067 RepID=A0A1N7LL44_9BACL|nr:tartrate dehydrogenase [Kroppenstedtia eburnea]QKI81284.1 tartrate dehydrogenase [Kroppenstedtia eburnea]SIS74512.1 tartrate dehydrogenase/decarboxylase / D-malate dehydrogenase [Kroppenstedtia eburnea]